MEKDFFMTEFLGEGRAELKCTIKELYSDFVVNEIAADGTVIDLPLRNSFGEVTKGKDEEQCVGEARKTPTPKFLTEEMAREIDAVAGKQREHVEMIVEKLDKEERMAIHNWIRDRYSGVLDSTTVDGVLRISLRAKKARKRKHWPADVPNFIHFTLSKENKDTHYALHIISKFLGMKISSFGICGTKDRRAVTTQRVSVYRCEIKRLQELNTKLRSIKLTDFVPSSEPCKLGNLWGNRFKIILRDVQHFDESDFISRIEDFKSKGFINYYGPQRFGTCDSTTAEVGRAILKKQWEEAVKLILKSRNAPGSIGKALVEWNESGNALAALRNLSGTQMFASIEGQLLSTLSKRKNDFRVAIMKLARNLRSLYVHAYQSLLWNKIASRRVRTKGYHPIAGDLNIHGQKIEDFEKEEVALPLLSGSSQFPDNEVRDWYEQIMAEDGVTSEMFKELEKSFAIGSVLRPLIVKPLDVKYKILLYTDARAKLQTDLQGDVDTEKIGRGSFRAVALEFSLPSGTYATVALRELMRFDMSKSSQATTVEDKKDFGPILNRPFDH